MRMCFFYFDPPYRPISKTSSFTSYSKDSFNDKDQEALADFCKELDSKGWKFIASNSDGFSVNPMIRLLWICITHSTSNISWHQDV